MLNLKPYRIRAGCFIKCSEPWYVSEHYNRVVREAFVLGCANLKQVQSTDDSDWLVVLFDEERTDLK